MATSGVADESGEAGVEVPEAVTVEIEEIHPLPEVSVLTTTPISVYLKIWCQVFLCPYTFYYLYSRHQCILGYQLLRNNKTYVSSSGFLGGEGGFPAVRISV